MLTDTHCHLDSDAFDLDRPAVIERALQAGVTRILIPGVTLESSRRALELAGQYPALFAAIGIHPTDPDTLDDHALAVLRTLAESPRVVAIGEIGLDYYWVTDPEKHAQQREALRAQLMLAQELRKPVVIHAREKEDASDGPCAQDLLSILEQWAQPSPAPGVLHSFSGSLETARRALELGFYIGVTGPVTYKNAAYRREVIAAIPLDRLLIETDSPYLAPHPYRGKRNEPAYVTHIADKIAEIQSRTPQEVVAVTGINAARLFSWGEAD
ncbi:MAG: TatD family hydrolase [Anaerolineales bacterium]